MDRNTLIKLVKGKWPIAKWEDGNEYGVYRCTRCGHGGDITERFCHTCGSFMMNFEHVREIHYACPFCGESLDKAFCVTTFTSEGSMIHTFTCGKCGKESKPEGTISDDDGIDEKIAARMVNMRRMGG